jgi:RNA polymerase sigma-70 factor (ECF subfamily)
MTCIGPIALSGALMAARADADERSGSEYLWPRVEREATSTRASSPVRLLDTEALGDHVDRLYRAAWALCGDPHDAEDLVQDTYARVLSRPRMLRNDDDLGYLMRALRNTHVTRLRTARRRPSTLPIEDEFQLPDHSNGRRPESVLETSELFAAIAALPQAFRDAVVAIDVAGLSYAEAARALRVREATITTRLHRGRSKLSAELRGGSR